jgi:hypothetical protein
MHVEKNSWKLITLCGFKIMLITNMLSKKTTLGGGGATVKNLIFQCGGEEFKSAHLQSRLLWLLR